LYPLRVGWNRGSLRRQELQHRLGAVAHLQLLEDGVGGLAKPLNEDADVTEIGSFIPGMLTACRVFVLKGNHKIKIVRRDCFGSGVMDHQQDICFCWYRAQWRNSVMHSAAKYSTDLTIIAIAMTRLIDCQVLSCPGSERGSSRIWIAPGFAKEL
jgi:hypothetical protein